MSKNFKSGFVAIIGRPNVGKSTLLNKLLNKKVAIVSSKPETTRDNIHGILTTEDAQAVFIDTPGIHKPHLLLGKVMVHRAESILLDGDIILYITELGSGLTESDRVILGHIKDANKPTIAVINKIDLVSKSRILPLINELKSHYDFLEYIGISALEDDGVDILKDSILKNLPEGEKYYPGGEVTNKSDEFHVSEVIREKVLQLTKEEVPHSIAVKVESLVLRESKDIIDIEATIYVERDSQKGIIVGKKGAMAKEISTLSRQELEEKFGKKIFIRTWVKVLKNWRKSPRFVKEFGGQG